jgi:hypothetical protein
MKKVRTAYEEIFNCIEGDDSDVRIEWTDDKNIATYPKFVPKKQPLSGSTNKIRSINSKNERVNTNSDLITTTTTTTTTTTIATTSKHSLRNQSDQLDIENLNYLELSNLKKMTKTELINLRENVSLEMLWIQQAIQSRMQVNIQ